MGAIMGYYRQRGTNVLRDNYWVKDNNGILRRATRLEGPRSGFSDFQNLVKYSAGPFQEPPGTTTGQWDVNTADLDSWENVISCIEGGTALKATSKSGQASRIQNKYTGDELGLYSGEIEVFSGIFERVNQTSSHINVWNEAGSQQLGTVWWNFSTGLNYDDPDSLGLIVDWGGEVLDDNGPNNGVLVHIWIAIDTVGYTSDARRVQFRIDNQATSETGILHHAQVIALESGFTFSNNGAPTSPIVNLGATQNTRGKELFTQSISFSPQALTGYIRFISRWRDGQHGLFNIGGPTGQHFKLEYNNGANGTMFTRHHDGSSSVDSSSAVTTGWGNLVEVVAPMYADGSVRLWVSVNGGAWTASTQSSTLAILGSWGENVVYINSYGSGSNDQGFIDLLAFKILKGSVSTTDECDWARGYGETNWWKYGT